MATINATLQYATTTKAAPMPRVLMVTARYYPYMGGVETHVYEVARRLVHSGVDLTICTTDPRGELPDEEVQNGVRIVRVPAWPAERDYYFAPALVSIITRGRWDLVHIQGYHTLVAPLAMATARFAGIPYIVSFHSGGHSSPLRNAVRGLQRGLLRPLLAGASQLVAVSQFERTFFRKQLRLGDDKFRVIANGANMPQVSGAAGDDDGGPLILSVGRLERYKGHHRVLAAFPHVLRQHPDARLQIIGAGPYEAALRLMVVELGLEQQVTIGAIAPSDRQGMADRLARAELVVLLSDYEAHPVSVMEALALGRPMLVANTSGLQEIADRGWARGIAVDSSPREVARAMLEQLGRPSAPAAVELPTWDGCADGLRELYREVSGRAACVS